MRRLIAVFVVAIGLGTSSPAAGAEGEEPVSVTFEQLEEKRRFLEALCGADRVEAGSCQRCPSYTTRGGDEERVRPDALLRIPDVGGAEVVVASFRGCEPHSDGYWTTVVLQRTDEGWDRAHAESGYSIGDCKPVDVSAPGVTFVCHQTHTNQGMSSGWVVVRQMTSPEEVRERVLVAAVELSGGVCRSARPYRDERIDGFAFEEETETLVVDGSARRIRVPEADDGMLCADVEEKYDVPQPQPFELKFRFRDGAFQVPTSKVDPEDHELRSVPEYDPADRAEDETEDADDSD